MQIKIKKLHPDAKVPTYAHPGDAGMDIFALERTEVPAREIVKIRTGLSFELPDGYVGLCWDKSGVSSKHGIKTLGGVLDSGYRGELMLAVANLKNEPHVFEKGDKVLQMLIQRVERPEIIEAAELSETSRAHGGFGSTGR